MPLDAYKNFAAATLAAGINSSATSLSVASGQGARFPAVPFNATIYNATDYADAADAYHAGHAEIVRVTAISTDTLTITRAQESTTAVNLNTGGKTYRIVAGLTSKFSGDLPSDGGTTEHPLGHYDPTKPTRMRQPFSGQIAYVFNGGGAAGVANNTYSAAYGFGGITLSPSGSESKVRPFSSSGEADYSLTAFTGTSRLGFGTLLKTPSVLSDATNNYELVFGFFPGGSWMPTSIACLYYNHSANGGKWLARSRQSSETSSDTGVTVAADTWYDLKIEANSTDIRYYINDSLVSTISTNLPSSSFGTQFMHWRVAGAVRTSYLKFMEQYYQP